MPKIQKVTTFFEPNEKPQKVESFPYGGLMSEQIENLFKFKKI
jgi:hypothetical protein